MDYSTLPVSKLRTICKEYGLLDCDAKKGRGSREHLTKLITEYEKHNKPPKLFKPSKPGEPQKPQTALPESVVNSLSILFQGPEMSPPIRIEFGKDVESPPKKRSILKKDYELVNINFNIEKVGIEKIKSSGKNSINIKEFEKELENPLFIKKFTISVKKLLKYKYDFYTKKFDIVKQDYRRIQEKIKKLKRYGLDDLSIKELFPTKNIYLGFLTQLKEIIQNIQIRINDLSEIKIKSNLKLALTDPNLGFASIVGRKNVKNNIVSQLYAFSQNYRVFTNSFNNICFLGKAGTGKTSISKVLAYVYSLCGILIFNTTKIVSRADLVAAHVGHTALKTQAVLMETLEGILFIDEAYQLGNKKGDYNSTDFGTESITEIVNFLDKYIGMNVVIVAGYPKEMMESFFPTNEGLSRRFPYKILLDDYSEKELTDILIQFIETKMGKPLSSPISNFLYSLIKKIISYNPSIFVNQAGDMLNLGTSIVKSINSAYKVKWDDSKPLRNIPIIREGFNDFLETKGYVIQI